MKRLDDLFWQLRRETSRLSEQVRAAIRELRRLSADVDPESA